MIPLIHDKQLRTGSLPQLFNFVFIKKLLLSIILLLICINANAQMQNMVWAREGIGTGTDQGNAITVDVAGNVYTTGYFESTVDFDPGAGVTNVTSNGNQDIFIMKSDASGNLIWVKSIGGTTDDEGKCIAVDISGNLYVAGEFHNTVDFDPGAGTSSLVQTTSYYLASFILKLNSAGNFVYVKQFGGTTGGVEINKILLDASANIVASGALVGTQDFDPGAPPVAEHEERAAFGIFAQALGHRRIQAVEAFAHVAGFECDEHFQTARKTQHDAAGCSSARSTAAASTAC